MLVEVEVHETFAGVGGVEEWRIKLTSAKVEVEAEVEAELGNSTI